MITTVAVKNYRSIRELVLPLKQLTVVTGKNGVGKSNLYKGLHLLAANAQGDMVRHLQQENGFSSTLWAGPESSPGKQARDGFEVAGTVRNKNINLSLGFASKDSYGYLLDVGLAVDVKRDSLFAREPDLKREVIFSSNVLRPSTLQFERKNHFVRFLDDENVWQNSEQKLRSFESALSDFMPPVYLPELQQVKKSLHSWRFYDYLRTDPSSPLRQPSLGIRTLSLAHDGHDLAAAVQTVFELGNAELMNSLLEEGLQGAKVRVHESSGFHLTVQQEGILRGLSVQEISDGMLKYIALCTALLSPAEPELIVLNEPENSIHADLIPALAKLIITASQTSQIIVVTHNQHLEKLLHQYEDALFLHLIKEFGETKVEGFGILDSPRWEWGKR